MKQTPELEMLYHLDGVEAEKMIREMFDIHWQQESLVSALKQGYKRSQHIGEGVGSQMENKRLKRFWFHLFLDCVL